MSFEDNNSNVRALVDDYGDLSEQIKALTAEQEKIKKQIKALVAESLGSGAPSKSLTGSKWVIEASMRSGSKTFPKESIEQAETQLGVDLSPFMKQNAPSITLKTVKL